MLVPRDPRRNASSPIELRSPTARCARLRRLQASLGTALARPPVDRSTGALRELEPQLAESCARAALPQRDRQLVLVVGRENPPREREAALRAALGPVAPEEKAVQVEVGLAAARIEGEREGGALRIDALEPKARLVQGDALGRALP